jgi:hypothetical protein
MDMLPVTEKVIEKAENTFNALTACMCLAYAVKAKLL